MSADRLSRSDLAPPDAANTVARALAGNDSLDTAAPLILSALAAELNADAAELWRVSRRSGNTSMLNYWVAPGLDIHEAMSSAVGRRLMRGLGLPGKVVTSRVPAWVPQVDQVKARCPVVELAPGLATAFTFPVRFGGDILAVMCFHGTDLGPPDERQLALLNDVGAQMGQFEARSRAQASVRRSEARKAAILESALDCIITVDHETKIVEFNPAAVRTFGWQPFEVIGRSVAEVLVPPASQEPFAHLVERVATMEGADGIKGERIEGIAVRKDGAEFPVELGVTRVDVAGPPFFIAYVRDISDDKAAELERESLLERERSARVAAEEAQQRMTFLAGAGRMLASSLDLDETLRKVAKLVVPWLADWCAIDMVGPGGEIQPAVIEHTDPQRVAWAYGLREAYPPNVSDSFGVAEVLRTGTSLLIESLDDDLLRGAARDGRHREALAHFTSASALIVPLRARRRAVGAISLVSADRKYDKADVELVEELARHAGLAIDNSRLYAEKSHIATTLQDSLLPRALPAAGDVQLTARYWSAGAGYDVGGDFYDVIELGDGRRALAVGDVQGKGPEAAALIGLARYTLRTAVRYEDDPARVLMVVNDAIRVEDSERLCTVTLALMEPDEAGCSVIVACGGHPQPVILRAGGEIEPAGAAGMLLGVFDAPSLPTTSHGLRPGDVLVMFSDGILLREASAVDLFRAQGLSASLSTDDLADAILASVPAGPDGGPRDDVSVLVAKMLG